MTALFLAMGFFGWVHLTTAVITAIYHKRLHDVNPYHLINIQQYLGGITNNAVGFAFGWLVFTAIVVGFYLLVRPRGK